LCGCRQCVGHAPGITGHVPEFGGHDAETAGHDGPKYADCLTQCPLHPRGGCGFASHGTYARKTPAGTRIARWYCREGHCTFSLLPDHLAARVPGTLAEIEQAALAAESAPSLEVCADALRPEPIGLPGALRWLRRRIDYVRAVLPPVVALRPPPFQGGAGRGDQGAKVWPLGRGMTGSAVFTSAGHTTLAPPGLCWITTGKERAFWPAMESPGGLNFTP
jgi:hypothetical protein